MVLLKYVEVLMNINFNFYIDKRFLTYYAILGKIGTGELKDKVGELSKMFQSKYPDLFNKINMSIAYRELAYKLTHEELMIIDGIGETKIMQQIYDETLEHRNKIESSWNQEKGSVNKNLTDILRIKKDDSIDVYVVHPSLNTRSNMEGSYILLGSDKINNDPVQGSVSLVHEYLDILFKVEERYMLPNLYKLQTIIELITDVELYRRISKKDNQDIRKNTTRENIKPWFYGYLSNSPAVSGDINDFIRNIMAVEIDNKETLARKAK
jgi:hypothetical protein